MLCKQRRYRVRNPYIASKTEPGISRKINAYFRKVLEAAGHDDKPDKWPVVASNNSYLTSVTWHICYANHPRNPKQVRATKHLA